MHESDPVLSIIAIRCEIAWARATPLLNCQQELVNLMGWFSLYSLGRKKCMMCLKCINFLELIELFRHAVVIIAYHFSLLVVHYISLLFSFFFFMLDGVYAFDLCLMSIEVVPLRQYFFNQKITILLSLRLLEFDP